MKAILIDKFVEKIEDIKISEVPDLIPKDDEALVHIEAAGARGKHQNNRSLVIPPFTLGLEFAGTVISSPSSSHLSPGSRVFGGSLGSYASHILISPSLLHPIPPTWTCAQAASLAATAPVSYGALILRGRLKAGETVLIHASAGGLGLAAIQIAKAAGATVIATASSSKKLSIAKRFGADACINYSSEKGNEKWTDEVLKVTGGKGVDVVFDTVGLVGESLRCLKQKGRVLVVGFAGRDADKGDLESVAMNRVLLKQAQIIGYRYGETNRIDPTETSQIWSALQPLWESGKLKPAVYEEEYRGLESVVRALKDLEGRKVWGKAVILMESGDSMERPKL
ncbi:hypothetical protein VTL71DRAFT_7613 [Oculimacula yallundae]|uniref:Enoyl reductase (ER) domain-containing protein n=1 Tax=Oculimacula yallundae TaxID=86028 RepID=A0ABR4BUL1_9HELO